MSDSPPSKNTLDDLLYPLPTVEQRVRARVQAGAEAVQGALTSTLKQVMYVTSTAEDITNTMVWAQRVLPLWAPKLFAELALELVQTGQGPDAPVRSPIELVEQEVARRSRKGRGDLNDLMELLNTFIPFSQTAGWLALQNDKAPRFADSTLPALLVGQAMGRDVALTQELRPLIGADSGWAEAAWAAVAQGDALEPWIDLFLAETEPLRLRERLIVTCHALGGLMPGQPPGERFAEAYHVCLAAVFWLFPARYRPPPKPWMEAESPWYLPRRTWQRCVLALAHAGRLGAERLGAVSTLGPSLWREPPGLLGRMIDALGWPPRLDEPSAAAILALCLPEPMARRGGLGESFWSMLTSAATPVGFLARELFSPWLRAFAVPAMVESLRPEYRRLLGLPKLGGPAGYLMQEEVPRWYATWCQLLESETPKDCIDAWLTIAQRWASHPGTEATQQLIFEAAPARLRERGLEAEMRAILRDGLHGYGYPPLAEADRSASYWLRLIELAAPEAADWERWIAEARSLRMPLDLWLAAGAPVELAVRSIVQVLRGPVSDPEEAERARAMLAQLAQTHHPQKLGKVLAEILAQPGDEERCQFERWPAGTWFDWLLHPSGELDPTVRRRALRYLATYSVHAELRRQSAETLLTEARDKQGEERDV